MTVKERVKANIAPLTSKVPDLFGIRAKRERMEEEQRRIFRGEIKTDDPGEDLTAKKGLFAETKEKIEKYIDANRKMVKVLGLYALFFINFAVMIIRIILFMITLNPGFIWHNGFYTIIFSVAPLICWVYATEIEDLNYYRRKMMAFTVFVFNAIIMAINPFLLFGLYAICPYIVNNIRISSLFTYNMALWACRLVVLILPVLEGLLICVPLVKVMRSDFFTDEIKSFKLSHIIDMRKDKEYKYDIRVINEIATSKIIPIHENDRGTHITCIGQTGTGKTATIIYPSIVNDLDQKVKNDFERQKALYEMIKANEAVLDIPEGADETQFRNSWVIPKKGFEQKYAAILEKYKTCCIIAIAPDNDLCDGVARLAIARGFKPKFIDPTLKGEPERMREFGQYWCGMNPFAVPKYLSEDAKYIDAEAKYIIEATKNIATMLEVIDSRNGKGDRFFSSVNRNITTVLSSICMLYFTHINKRQANWSDIQRSMDFSKIEGMVSALEDLFGKCVKNEKESSSGSSSGRGNREEGIPDENGILCGKAGSYSNTPLQKTPWEPYFNYVLDEMTGSKGEKVLEYSYGLRNMINEFLGNPYVKDLFSASDDNCISLSDSFEAGDVIVVNYGLKLGDDTAIATGLAFQLMVNHAMLNRTLPKEKGLNPSPVFEYMDEMPVLLSQEWLSPVLSLSRKYGFVLFSALQTTAQLNKNESTKYLKGLLLGVGTIICFGRAALDEMESLSELSGLNKRETITKTTSSSSLVEASPTSNTSERTAVERVPAREKQDIRGKDFKEVTVLTCADGRVLDAQDGVTHFLEPDDWKKKNIKQFDWRRARENYKVSAEDKVYIDEFKKKLDERNTNPLMERFKKEGVKALVNDDVQLPPTSVPVSLPDEPDEPDSVGDGSGANNSTEPDGSKPEGVNEPKEPDQPSGESEADGSTGNPGNTGEPQSEPDQNSGDGGDNGKAPSSTASDPASKSPENKPSSSKHKQVRRRSKGQQRDPRDPGQIDDL